MNTYKDNDKLYVITRRDMSPGYQAVQSIHAAIQFFVENESNAKEWNKVSNYVVLLSVEDETRLVQIMQEATSSQIKHSMFQEPDIGNQITAVTLEPGQKSATLCKKLRLAFT